jgi:hypothetical protein
VIVARQAINLIKAGDVRRIEGQPPKWKRPPLTLASFGDLCKGHMKLSSILFTY